jgi:hypothetical protein
MVASLLFYAKAGECRRTQEGFRDFCFGVNIRSRLANGRSPGTINRDLAVVRRTLTAVVRGKRPALRKLDRPFETAPTAANGFVYLVGGSGGTILFAIDEGSGSIVWQQFGQSGTGSTPAVTSQGVYIAAVCTTDGFAPITGVSLFADNGPCTGGGGATAVVANNVLYSLLGDAPNGIYVNALTGAQLGTFTADVVPAVNSTTGFFLQSGTLNARSLSDYSTMWSFRGDGGLVTSPSL